MNDAAKNKYRFAIGYAAKTVALMFASGTLMQTYLASLGFSTHLIHLHTSFLQAANVLTILLCARWANRGNLIRRTAMTAIPTALLFLLYVPTSLMQNASFESYLLLVGVGIAQQVAIGLSTACEYKLPYYIFHAEEYGTVLSVCGIIASLLSLGVGALVSALTASVRFSAIMAASFFLSAILMGIVFLTTRAQKDLNPEHHIKEKENDLPVSALLKYPLFTRLIPANFARGFAAGISTVLATVALERGFTEGLTASMISAQSAASLAACALFALLSMHTKPLSLLIAGSFAMVLLPFLLTQNGALFLIIYTVIIFGRTLIDYAVPAMLIRMVEETIAGPYHAWRMVLHNAGILAATAIAAYLPVPWLLAIGAATQFLSGISYWLVSKKHKK